MSQETYIKNTLIIRNAKIFRDGGLIYEADASRSLNDFLKTIYKDHNLKYPKFFKMDRLSKLGFLGMELLTQGNMEDKNTALIFANSASSLDTDENYAGTMNSYPSPALFVYTLPNIMLGEISIRHQLRSENTFLISDEFDPSLFLDYATPMIQQKKADNIVCGWVNLHNNEYDVFLWQIAPDGSTRLNEEELMKLYLPTHE